MPNTYEQTTQGQEKAQQQNSRGLEKNYNFRMFQNSVDFKVKDVPIKGEAGEDIPVAPITLFSGAILDLSGTRVKGNKRGGRTWVESYGGLLKLNPKGAQTTAEVALSSVWIGVKDEKKDAGSIILQSAGGVRLDYEKVHYTAQMLWMSDGEPETTEQLQLHMVGMQEVDESGAAKKADSADMGLLTANFVSAGSIPDLGEESERRKKKEEDQRKAEEAEAAAKAEAEEDAAAKAEAEAAAKAEAEAAAKAEAEKAAEPEPEEPEPAESEQTVTEQFLDNIKELGMEALNQLKAPQDLLSKIGEVKEAVSILKLGEEVEEEDDSDDDHSMSITLVEVPILPPFIWAGVTLEAKLEIKPHFALDIKQEDLIDDYKKRATEKLNRIISSPEEQNKLEDKRKPLSKEAMLEYLRPTDRIKAHIGASGSIGLDASIELRVSAGTGIPRVLTITAGLFANVGVHGASGENNEVFKVSGGADLGYDFAKNNFFMDNMNMNVGGSLEFYVGAGADIVLQSEIFEIEQELIKYEKTANLAGFSITAALSNSNALTSDQGLGRNMVNLVRGWQLDSADITATGLLSDFLAKNPKDKGFNILTDSVFSAPLKEADDAIEAAGKLLKKLEEGGAQLHGEQLEKEYPQFPEIILALEKAKEDCDKLSDQLKDRNRVSNALEVIRQMEERNENIVQRLESMKKEAGTKAGTELTAVDADVDETVKNLTAKTDRSDFKKFRRDKSREKAEQEAARYDNIKKYEEGRKEELGEKHGKRIAALNAKIIELKISAADMDKPHQEFSDYYSSLSNSAFKKDITGCSSIEELKMYEMSRMADIRKDNKKRLDAIITMMVRKGIADLPRVEYGDDIAKWEVGSYDNPSYESKRAFPAVWEEYKSKFKGKEFVKELAEFMSREDLIDQAEGDLLSQKESNFSISEATRDQTGQLHAPKTYNHVFLFTMLKGFRTDIDNNVEGAEEAYEEFEKQQMKEKLFDFYKNDSDFALALMSPESIKSYEKARLGDYVLENAEKDALKNAMTAHLEESLSLMLEYEERASHNKSQKKHWPEHEKRVKLFRKDLDKLKELNEAGLKPGDTEEIQSHIRDYMDNHKRFYDQLKSGKGSDLDPERGKLNVLSDSILRQNKKLETNADVKRHLDRLQRMEGTTDIFSAWMGYIRGDNPTEFYKTVLEQSNQLKESRTETVPGLSLDAWLSYEKLKLEKGAESSWEKVAGSDKKKAGKTAPSKIQGLDILRGNLSDEDATKRYMEYMHLDKMKLSADRIKQLAKPDRILKFECRNANEIAAKHLKRMEILNKQSGPEHFEETAKEYRRACEQKSKATMVLTAVGIHRASGYEKMLKAQGTGFLRSPQEIMSYEIHRKAELEQKHTERLARLENFKDTEGQEQAAKRYMNEAGKGFLRSKKSEIDRQVKEDMKKPATFEEKIEFHKAQAEQYKKSYDMKELPLHKLEEKKQELDKEIKHLYQVRNGSGRKTSPQTPA